MSVREYPKIDTLFDRYENFAVNIERIRRPEFLVPKGFIVTEKIDGTNVRVSLERFVPPLMNAEGASGMAANAQHDDKSVEWCVRFYGHHEKSQMPPFLLEYLQETFTLGKMKALWRGPGEAEYPIVLYGEGYGAKIQSGGDYRKDSDVSFRLFDVLIGESWLRRVDVESVATQLYILPVPYVYLGQRPIDVIVAEVRVGIPSVVANLEGVPRMSEGVIAFTDPPLFNSRGKRLTFKLKTSDFVSGKR